VKHRRHRQPAAVDEPAREGMPFAKCSTASRTSATTALFGVMKSVERVELRMFSSAASVALAS
jgi:hypothetical protein